MLPAFQTFACFDARIGGSLADSVLFKKAWGAEGLDFCPIHSAASGELFV
jgi:hypothetical protein